METVRTVAFIDWDTARRLLPYEVARKSRSRVEDSIFEVQKFIAEILTELPGRHVYRVQMRLYHGWHKKLTKTDDRREFEAASLEARVLGRVSFANGVVYGNELLCGGKRFQLYDTLRANDGVEEQKMVDTALVSDLLHYARTQSKDLALVVGDDDDLLPGVFTAEVWGAKVLVLRIRPEDSKHLKTDRLILRRGQ